MADKIPPELRKIAGDAAKAELADSEDQYTRQIARQVGEVVLQAVWAWLAGES